jgi:hypothetical protein
MVLGMGMPTTAVYVLLAALVAPGLSKLGDCTHCRPLVHLLLRDAEHDHAAGLFGELSGWSDQTNSFSPRRNRFTDSDRLKRQVCSPNLGQQQYRARFADLTCIGGVVGALVSRQPS